MLAVAGSLQIYEKSSTQITAACAGVPVADLARRAVSYGGARQPGRAAGPQRLRPCRAGRARHLRYLDAVLTLRGRPPLRRVELMIKSGVAAKLLALHEERARAAVSAKRDHQARCGDHRSRHLHRRCQYRPDGNHAVCSPRSRTRR